MNSEFQAKADSTARQTVTTRSNYKGTIVWPNLLGFLLMHAIGALGGLYGLLTVRVYTILWTAVLVFCSGLGITIGAHRLFTHRSFRAVWGLRLGLVLLQTVAGQNCLYIWVRDHRQHHKYSDTDADPHNSGRGFFFSHIGWLMMRKHPDVLRLGSTIDMSDMEADPLVMFQKKYYKPLYAIFALFVPVGVPLLWGESLENAVVICFFSRNIIQLNVTWMVNSWAHFFGTRPYNKNIQSMESLLVSLVTFGEGWHNFHHCFPWDYRASEYNLTLDWSTKIIDWCARRGWAYGLKTAPASMVRRRAWALGDGSHAVWGAGAELVPGPPSGNGEEAVDTDGLGEKRCPRTVRRG